MSLDFDAASGRRREPRVVPSATTPVIDTITHQLLGYAIDISNGGMSLLAAHPLQAGAVLQVEFELDCSPQPRARVAFGAEVLRTQSCTAGGDLIGLRFFHPQGDSACVLRSWLAGSGAC